MTTDAPYKQGGTPITTAGAGTVATTNVAAACTNGGQPAGAMAVQITGTFTSCTLVVEGDLVGDGANWHTLEFRTLPGSVLAASISPTSGTPIAYLIPHAGFAQVRVRATALTIGGGTGPVPTFVSVAGAPDYPGSGGGGGSATAALQTSGNASLAAAAASLASIDTHTAPNATPLAPTRETVGTSQGQLGALAATQGVVFLKSLLTNTGIVYYGITGVTTSTGYPIYPGQEAMVLTTNANKIFMISDTASQAVAVSAQ